MGLGKRVGIVAQLDLEQEAQEQYKSGLQLRGATIAGVRRP